MTAHERANFIENNRQSGLLQAGVMLQPFSCVFVRSERNHHNWDFPFADSKVAILLDFGPISRPKDHADDKCLFLSAKSVHFLLQECCGGRLRTKRRSSNRLLVEIVMFVAYRDRDTQTRRSNGGGTPTR